MINLFLKFKTNKLSSKFITQRNIDSSSKVLFALFTRYGDTIISLQVIKEFIEKFPKKNYLILCPKQMEPYVNKLLPGISCISFNKRNLIELLRVVKFLKKWKPEIGFNPWSNGLDSCYFISFCKYFFCYKDFVKKEKNHYQVIRKYLQLDLKEWTFETVKEVPLKRNILICPDSTDILRSMDSVEIEEVIKWMQMKDSSINITIASMHPSDILFHNKKDFIFKKNSNSSLEFIKLVNNSDQVIAVDSAPMHLALALKKETIINLKITKKEDVINSESSFAEFKNFFKVKI